MDLQTVIKNPRLLRLCAAQIVKKKTKPQHSHLFLSSDLGADLKEREKMDDAEVGHFVKRLRNLMDEIGL